MLLTKHSLNYCFDFFFLVKDQKRSKLCSGFHAVSTPRKCRARIFRSTKLVQERDDGAVSEHARSDAFAWGSIVEGGPLDTESEYDRRLSVGAATACRVRGAVRDKLGQP